MSKFTRFLRYGWRHKYFWAIAIFVAVVGFLDPNSFWNRRLHKERISELKADISRYQHMYAEDTRRLREERKFSSVNKLVDQLCRDRAEAERILAG